MLKSRPFLIAEFILLCLVVPAIIIFGRFAPMMFAFLWGATVYCAVIYRLCYFKSSRDMWRWREVTWPHLKPILLRFVLATAGMALFILWYDPERFLYVPREHPQILPWLLIAYPLISALPQEFIFCTYFFRRYKPFFGEGKLMIWASAIIFAWVHCLYINPVAPTLSLLGGLIFAQTYFKHKSLALVTIEHGLYGNALFILGLGWYFYGGSVTQ